LGCSDLRCSQIKEKRIVILAYAERTWEASVSAGRTSSYRGSEPNCTTRVTYLAFGLLCRAAKSVSRRVFQILPPSNPNYIHDRKTLVSYNIRWRNDNSPRSKRAPQDHCEIERSDIYESLIGCNDTPCPCSIYDVVVEASSVTST
jgi:hypothetical protein